MRNQPAIWRRFVNLFPCQPMPVREKMSFSSIILLGFPVERLLVDNSDKICAALSCATQRDGKLTSECRESIRKVCDLLNCCWIHRLSVVIVYVSSWHWWLAGFRTTANNRSCLCGRVLRHCMCKNRPKNPFFSLFALFSARFDVFFRRFCRRLWLLHGVPLRACVWRKIRFLHQQKRRKSRKKTDVVFTDILLEKNLFENWREKRMITIYWKIPMKMKFQQQ